MSTQGGKTVGKPKGRFKKRTPIKRTSEIPKEGVSTSVSSKYKFHPMGDSASSTPRHTFTTVVEHLLDSLGKTTLYGLDDILESIQDLKHIDFNEQMPDEDDFQSTLTDPAKAAKQQRLLDKALDEEMKMWTRKKHDYKLNLGKAFAIIKDDWCTPSMLHKQAQHPGWQDQLLPS